MTKYIRDSEIPVDLEDTVVDFPLSKRELPLPKDTLSYFRNVKVGLREGRYDHYTVDQLINLQATITTAYAKMHQEYNEGVDLDPLLGSFLNDYLIMWSQICDLKEKKGYVPVNVYDNEPETKR